MEPGSSKVRERGRPRDSGKDTVIRNATWDVLAEKGFDGLSFDRVAAVAGCGRNTIYRRYSSKIDLIEATLYETSESIQPVITDDMHPRDVLLAHAQSFLNYMHGPRRRATLSIMEAAARVPDLAMVTNRHKERSRHAYFAIFRRLKPDADDEHLLLVFETYVGIFQQHTIMQPVDLSSDQVESLVDVIISLLGRHS